MKTKFLPIIFVAVILICKTNISQAQVNVQDSLALVDFYQHTNGKHWKDSNKWLTANPVSTWFGITVSLGRVTAINLPYNRLSGFIPASFGNLTNLQTLNLSGNKLTSLPASFGNLANLQTLNLSINKLTSLPASFWQSCKASNFKFRF